MSNKATEVLRGTIDVLQTRGWTRYTYANAQGEMCLVRALDEASKGLPQDAYAGAYQAVVEVTGYTLLSGYNDSKAETVEDVILACKRAIEYLEDQ